MGVLKPLLAPSGCLLAQSGVRQSVVPDLSESEPAGYLFWMDFLVIPGVRRSQGQAPGCDNLRDRLLGAFDGAFRDRSASVAVIGSEGSECPEVTQRARSPRKTQATSHRKPISGLIPRDRLTVSKRL